MSEPAPAPAPEPILYYQGQPTSREQAAATRTALMADPAFAKAAIDGDTAKQAQLRDLYMLERGVQPMAAAPMETADDVEIQQLDRAAREGRVHIESVRRTAGWTDAQVNEIVHQRPISAGERAWHEQQLALLMRDKEAVKRYLDGDRQMAIEFRRHQIGRKLPVGTAADLEAWERAHPPPRR
jgi:hypothetical protein